MITDFPRLTTPVRLIVLLFFSSDLFRDRDLRSDLRSSLSSRSFIGIRWFKRLEFRLETAVPFNQLEQAFAPIKIRPSFNLLEPSCFLPPFVFRFFVRFVLSLQPEFLSWTFWFVLLFEFYQCISEYLLCACCLSAIDYPDCAACYFETLGLADHQQGK